MFKKIMKIAGIVFGGVAVFTGAVFGVMAAMGKFKKKKIYPNRLFFAETEQVVIYDDEESEKFYSFVVSGENTESKYAVNQKDCYISFVNKEASNLIELYDKNKNKLNANQAGRFEVECNEPVYYKIKPQSADFTGYNFGKAVIHALGEELSMVVSNKDLTIWIDRKVNVLEVNDEFSEAAPAVGENEFAKQYLTTATTQRLYFDYTAKPFASLYPTTKTGDFYGEKEVELYYKAGVADAYEKIDLNTNLNKFNGLVGWDENIRQFYFVSSEVGTYDFYIATFATYQDKIDYYAEIEANPDDEHSIKERLDRMVVTNLNIRTYDIGVKDVSIGADDITFDFRNNNLVTLTETVAGGTNLKLTMIGSDDRQNFSRLNSVEFIDNVEKLGLRDVGKTALVDTVNESNVLTLNLTDVNALGVAGGKVKANGNVYDVNYIYENGKKITLFGESLVYLTNASKEYVCSDGYLLFNQAEGTLKLLPAGTYLGFFEEVDGYNLIETTDPNFTYSADKISGETGRWNIDIKEYNGTAIPNVYLKCLVVNSKDAYKYGKLVTATYQVAIEEVGLYYDGNFTFKDIVVDNKLTLNKTLTAADERTFKEVVTIGDNVSFNQCVFVIEEDEDGKYEIVVDETKIFEYDDGAGEKNYVLVGYYDETTGKFVNNIKANKQIKDIETKVYVMQLKTTATEVVETMDIKSEKVHAIKTSNPINVDVLYIPGETGVEYAYPEDVFEVDESIVGFYANQIKDEDAAYEIALSGTDLDALMAAGLTKDNFKVYLNNSAVETNMIEINSWDETNKKLIIDTSDYVEDYAIIALEFNGVSIKTQPIYLVSIKPENVSYFYTETESSELYVGEKLADYDKDVYKITLGLSTGEIQPIGQGIYNVSGVEKSSSAIELNLTNRNVADLITTGFKTDIEDVVQSFAYDSTDKDVFEVVGGNSIKVNRVGTAYLKVTTTSGYVGYLKVEVVDDGTFTITDDEGTVYNDDEFVGDKELETPTSEYLLKSGLAYKHGSDSIDKLIKVLLKGSSQDIEYFGGGSRDNIIYEYKDDEHIYYYGGNSETDTILTISIDGDNGWKFTRNNFRYSELVIKFEVCVDTRLNPINITLKFDPATKINFNSEWNNQQVYAGTSILLTEETEDGAFTHQPYYKITNKNMASEPVEVDTITLNGTDKLSCYDKATKVFTPDEIGTYTIIFSNEETRTIEVVDNVVAILNGTEFKSEQGTVSFIELKSYQTGIVYGQTGVGIYPVDKATLPVALSSSLAIKDASNKYLKYNGTKFYTSAILDLNAEPKHETISLTYNGNKLVICNSVEGTKHNAIDIKITNIYSVENKSSENMFITAYTNRNVYDMITIKEDGSDVSLDLSNVKVSGSNLAFTCSGKTFVSDGSITEITTKSVTFTFEGGYTYTTNVELRPYLPSKAIADESVEQYRIYAGDSGTSWKEHLITTETVILGVNNTKIYYNYDAGIITDVKVAYPEGYDNSDKVIKFNADGSFSVGNINGKTKKVRLCFTFTYEDGGEYTDIIDVIITNSLTIKSIYPYDGLTITKQTLSSTDAKFNEWYLSQSDVAFEPVLVGQSVSLFADGLYNNRIEIENKFGDSYNEDNISVKIVAASEILKSYSLNYNESTKLISFTSNGGLNVGGRGYIVLQITTSADSYTYYTIQLVNKEVASNSELKFSVEDNQPFVVDNTDDTFLGESIKEDILNKFSGLGANSDNASFYLINWEGIAIDNGYGEDEIDGLISDTNNLKDKTLPELYNFVTLKVALIYKDGSNYLNAGILTFYVTPKKAPSGTLANAVGYQNGYYTATIENNDNPFNESNIDMTDDGYISGATLLVVDDDIVGEYVRLDGTTIKIDKYVSDSAEFRVKYYFTNGELGKDRYVRIVTYTLKKFDMTSIVTNKSVTTGNFDESSKKFIKTVKLDGLVGNYNRNITIGSLTIDMSSTDITGLTGYDAGKNQVKIIVDGKTFYLGYDDGYYLEFVQENKDYNLTLRIVYNDVVNPNVQNVEFARTVNVTVKSSINMNLDAGYGANVSNPLLTTLESNPYETTYPNYIEIKKELVGSVYKYTISGSNLSDGVVSGFTLYAESDAKLEISFNDYSFVQMSVDDYIYGTTENVITNYIDNSFKIYFTHVGATQGLTMTIKVKDSEGNYYKEGSGNVDASKTLYLNIQRTYTGLGVNYLINGANHEVIDFYNDSLPTKYASSYTHTLTEDYFFKDINESEIKEVYTSIKINNKNRFTLNVPNGLTLPDSTDLGEILEAMGFFTENNPNEITFLTGANYQLNLGTNTVLFSRPSQDTWVDFRFSNNYFGAITYSFNLLSSKNNISQSATIVEGSQVTFKDNYATIIVNDNYDRPEDTETYLVGGKDVFVNLATIKDSQNSVYYITAFTADNADDITLLPIEGGKEYSLETTDGYTFTIQLKNGELGINLKAHADRTKFDTKVYKFTLYGDGKIAENFEIVFANYDISFVSNDVIQNDMVIDLNSKISIIKNSETTATNVKEEDLNSAVIVSGSYEDKVNGKTYTNWEQLVSYDDNNKAMTLKAIASEVSATIKFEVRKQNPSDLAEYYSLGEYEYTFTALRNFAFKINNNTIKGNSVETDYLLSQKHIDSDYADNYTTKTETDEDYSVHGVLNTYSTDLKLEMVKLDNSTDETIVGTTEMNGYLNVTSSNPDVVEFDKTTNSIKFKQEYFSETEPLILTINVDMTSFGRGKYTFTWYINPVGFINMIPNDSQPVLTNNREGFISGQFVNLLSKATSESQGIDFFHTDGTAGNNIGEKSGIPFITVKSMVSTDPTAEFNESSSYTVSKFYDANGDQCSDVKTNLIENNLARVELPFVPQSSSSSATHYVTYQVVIQYQLNGKGYDQTKYVTYGVRNPENLSNNGNAVKKIDVDNNSMDASTPAKQTFTYTKDGNKLLIFFNDNGFTPATGENKPVPIFNLNASEYMDWENVDDMYIRFKMDKETSDKTGTVFDKKFVDGHYDEDDCVYFKLVSINGDYDPNAKTYETGGATYSQYTIDIADPYVNITKVSDFVAGNKTTLIDTNTLFRNFLNADLDIMCDGEALAGIKAYGEDNKTGFRLETTKAIRSVGEDEETTYKLIDLFKVTDYFDANTYAIRNEMVLGLSSDGDPAENWVKDDVSGTINFASKAEVGDITIHGTSSVFTVYSSVYTKNSGTSLYSLSRKFYIVDSGDDASLVGVNLTLGTGVTFEQLAVEDYKFTQNNFLVYQMSGDNYLQAVDPTTISPQTIGISTEFKIGQVNYIADTTKTDFSGAVSIINGEIYVSKAFLQAYKNKNQSENTVLMTFITNDLTLKDIKFSILFALPSATISIDSTGFGETISTVESADGNVITQQIPVASSGNDGLKVDLLDQLQIDSYTIGVDKKISLKASEYLTSANITNIQVLTNPEYVDLKVNAYGKYTDMNLLIGKNTANGLDGKSAIYDYLYTTAHESISIEIQVTYDIDGDTDKINDMVTTTFVLEFKKA